MVFAHDVNLYHTVSRYCPCRMIIVWQMTGVAEQVSLSAAVDRLAQDLYELEGHFVHLDRSGLLWPWEIYTFYMSFTQLITCYLHVTYMLFICYLHVTYMLFTCYLHVTYMLFTCYVHYVHVIYMLFTCYLHVIYMLFTCCLHVVYM